MASSASSSGLSWNIVLPDKSTIMAPVVYMDTQVTFTVMCSTLGLPNNAAATNPLFTWGKDTAFCDYPMNSMFDVVNVTLNSASLSWEASETIDFLKRLIPSKLVDVYATTCPTAPDNFLSYSSVAGGPNDVLAGLDKADFKHSRGAYLCGALDAGAVPVPQTAGSAVIANGTANLKPYTFTVHFYEPLLLSPFQLANDKYSCGGFEGVGTFRLITNFVQAANNYAIRSTTPGFVIQSVSCTQANCFLEMFFVTPPPEMIIPNRNVRPYLDIVRNVTPVGCTVVAGAVGNQAISSQQLATLPSKICVGVRLIKSSASKTCGTPDYWLPIQSVQLTLANSSALFDSCNNGTLYNISVEAGLNDVPWSIANGYSVVGGAKAATAGSFFVCDVGKHIAIDSAYAPGSLGSFSFYGNVNFLNTTSNQITSASNYELVILFLNSCIMVTEMGSTSVYPSILSKEMVLECSSKPSTRNPNKIAILSGGSWVEKELKFYKKKHDRKQDEAQEGSGITAGSKRLLHRLK